MAFCLDTNVIIFALNRRRPLIAKRLSAELSAGTALLVPTVVLFELEYGLAKSVRPEAARHVLDTFLAAGFEQPAFDADDAQEAADIRAYLESKGTPIGPFDYLIAAQARGRGATLVTTNLREFQRVPGLAVADWSI